jgi:class 3 adenylate cyclase
VEKIMTEEMSGNVSETSKVEGSQNNGALSTQQPAKEISREITYSQQLAIQAANDDQEFANSGITEAVMFVDVVGSTHYKQLHSSRKGLAKVLQHNNLATECITKLGGTVVKFLGDGLLATFWFENDSEGKLAAQRAIQASLQIIQQLKKLNTDQKLKYPHDISTRISVHVDKVWPFKYSECSPILDPQGSTVDLAARILKLVPPNQIICTKETWALANRDHPCDNVHTMPEVERFVAGVPEIQQLITFSIPEVNLSQAELTVVNRAEADDVKVLLKKAKHEFEEGKFTEAIQLFNDVLHKDKGNFEANFYLGEFYVQKANGAKEEFLRKLAEKAYQHLCLAKKIRPDICRVWLYLSSAVYKINSHFKNSNLQEWLRHIDSSVEYADKALEKANYAHDYDGCVEAKSWLARLLSERSEIKKGLSLPHLEDISKAGLYCTLAKKKIDTVFEQHKANLYISDALVRMSRGDTDCQAIDELLQKAMQMNPNCIRALDAKIKFIAYQNQHNDTSNSWVPE